MSNTKVPHHERPGSMPPATDYHVGMRPLTGRTVVITGHKVDGTAFTRTLVNCSYVPGHGVMGHTVLGLDIAIGQVRTFRLALVDTLTLLRGGQTLRGMDLAVTMQHHISELGGGEACDKVFDAEAVAA